MDEKDFTSDLNGWLKGTSSWPEMDAYERMLTGDGGRMTDSLLPEAVNLAVWLFGDNLEEWMQ